MINLTNKYLSYRYSQCFDRPSQVGPQGSEIAGNPNGTQHDLHNANDVCIRFEITDEAKEEKMLRVQHVERGYHVE